MADEADLLAVDSAAPSEVGELDLYQHREKIYTRRIEGYWQRIRLYTGWPLLLGYFALPWLSIDGHPAVLFDLPARKFHILTLTFWPQDLVMLAFLLIIAAFALFTVTAFAGRVWCGYTCPQTVWTAIYMYIEQLFEGSRNQRIKLDAAPMSVNKLTRKTLKHGGWLVVALATGVTFIGYFTPIQKLIPELLTLDASLWALSWTLFFTLATYINAGWMREQVCIYMCPYARFQSVMFDKDTLIVSYDSQRGEPRGARKRDGQASSTLGDCVDCQLCVQVCPTGIDIRDGLQYQCIGCALCIDACDSIMDKMGYPKGLVSYSSENTLAGKETQILRPRLLGYVAVLLIMLGVFAATLATRDPLNLTVIRERDQLYREAPGGLIDNVFQLRLTNMDDRAREFQLTVQGLPNAEIVGVTRVTLDAGELRSLSVRVRVSPDTLPAVGTPFDFMAIRTDDPDLWIRRESRFIKAL